MCIWETTLLKGEAATQTWLPLASPTLAYIEYQADSQKQLNSRKGSSGILSRWNRGRRRYLNRLGSGVHSANEPEIGPWQKGQHFNSQPLIFSAHLEPRLCISSSPNANSSCGSPDRRPPKLLRGIGTSWIPSGLWGLLWLSNYIRPHTSTPGLWMAGAQGWEEGFTVPPPPDSGAQVSLWLWDTQWRRQMSFSLTVLN